MKVPLSWLKEFVDVDIPARELSEKLLFSGTKVEEVKRLTSDYIFDLEITSNRPDTMSVIGVAREIAAILDKNLNLETRPTNESEEPQLAFEIKQSQTELVPVYSAAVVDGLKIKKSFPKIAQRLEKSGIRPLLNLIDITNYVMLETGLPMHAFDYDQISGHIMNVRASQEGERLVTLDGIKRDLKPDTIIIEDDEKIIDLAGIMGCKNTAVTSATKRSLLLVAVYEPVRIRKASRHLGLRTEASSRFEKLLDLEATGNVLDRAIELVSEECGGKVASKIVHKRSDTYTRSSIELEVSFVNRLLGLDLTANKMEGILRKLGFEVFALPLSQKPTLRVTAPSWRRDICLTEDLVEEIGRIYGYNEIPTTLPIGTPPLRKERTDWEREGKAFLTSLAFYEAVGNTLISKKEIANVGLNPSSTSKVALPMSLDYEYLRPTLFIGLLKSAAHNQKLGRSYPYFELGRIFPKSLNHKNLLGNQPLTLACIYPSGDLSLLKGYLELLLKKLGVLESKRHPVYKESQDHFFIGGEAARVSIGEAELGVIGQIKNVITRSFDLDQDWSAFCLDWSKLVGLIPEMRVYQPIPKYPPVIQDLSVLIEKNIPINNLIEKVKFFGRPTLKDVEVFDTYIASSLGAKKSVGLRLTFQETSRTLEEPEVNMLREKIIKLLEKHLKAQIRA